MVVGFWFETIKGRSKMLAIGRNYNLDKIVHTNKNAGRGLL